MGDVGRIGWGLDTIRAGLATVRVRLAMTRVGLVTMRVGLGEGDLAVSVPVLDCGLDEGVGEASGRLCCFGLIGGEMTAALDEGRLPVNLTVGLGDFALSPRPSVGDLAL